VQAARKRERLRRFEELCRQRGLSLTVQRRLILEAVLDRVDHPTVDTIYDEVKQRIPGVSRTTVYRVLETLTEVGVVTKVCSPGAAARFDPVTQRHHHLVCLRCNRLIDLTDERLDQLKLPDVRPLAFEIKDYSIHFHGICAACRRGSASKKGKSKNKVVRANGTLVRRRKESANPKWRTKE
jgi:Fur family peroxide stress response transcriptional regulator